MRAAPVLAALTSALALAACSGSRPRPPPDPQTDGAGPREWADYAHRIENEAQWHRLAASPGRATVAHTEVVKVLIDMDDDWNVWFLQSDRWPIHYFFARRYLSRPGHPVGDHASYNLVQYQRPDRRFVNALVVHYRDQDRWTFELDASDSLDLDRTLRAYAAVRERIFTRTALAYRPVPAAQEAQLDAIRARGVPVVTTQEIYGNTRFQPLNVGEAYGYLRLLRGEPDRARVRRTDVVVLDDVPLDLPVCAGIITSELQAPLGHVGVLAANRGTPNMALRGAIDDPQLRALEGRLVRLHVTAQEWSVTPAAQADAERSWDARRPRAASSPPLEATDAGMPEITALGYDDLRRVGAKAAQLAELAHVAPAQLEDGTVVRVNTPRAFALPFHFYLDHLHRNGLDAQLAALLARPDFQNDPLVRDAALRDLRARIETAPIAPGLTAAVRARIQSVFPGVARVRFRSSTNAEDLPGFNGAGLYQSTVASVGGTDAELADAIRRVWASLWSLPGYEERAYFRVDPARVAMAVLVQESIDDDVVDGVAITANPFDEGRPGIFINAQVAGAEGGAVTSARGGEVPEQVLFYTFMSGHDIERLSGSSRTHGAPVLSDAELLTLGRTLQAVAGHFGAFDWWGDQAADVEFILAGRERRLVIVQARPFAVRYTEGRTWAQEPE